MALTYKTSASSWLTWTAGTGSTQDGIIDSTAAGASSFTAGNTLTLGSLWVQPTAATNITATTSLYATVLCSRGGNPSGYTLYLADNHTLGVTLQIAFDGSASGSANHSVYVGTGSTINANTSSLTGTANVAKYGPGTWRLAASENGGTSAGNPATLSSLAIYGGTVQTGTAYSGTANAIGTGTLTLDGGTLNVTVSRNFGNPVSMAGAGTISVNGGATATWAVGAAASGSGVLTIAGAGTTAWNASISCPLNVTGTLSLGSTYNLSGATLTGDGTINTAGSYTTTISNDAPTFTGLVSGSFNYSGTNKTFGGQITGNVKVLANQSVTFSRTGNHSGVLEDVQNGANVTVQGTFTGGTSSTYLDIWYGATVTMDGPNANVSGPGNPNISVWDKGTLWLTNGATVTPLLDLTYDGGGGVNAGSPTIGTNDTNTNTYSGTLSCSGSPARGNVKLLAKTNGVFVLSGTAIDLGGNTRPFAINGVSGYDGTVRLTGGGFNNPSAPVNHLSGTLQINRVGAVQLGAGLTVSANATLHCATSTGAYAAQLTGTVTLAAGSTMKFAA